MGTSLTKSRVLAVVQALADVGQGPVSTGEIVAAVRAAPWAERYRYQRIYMVLIWCRHAGLLRSEVRQSVQRGIGRRNMVHHWWPVPTIHSVTGSVVARRKEIAALVDQTIAGLATGTVLHPTWVVQTAHRRMAACTEAAVTVALQHRDPSQRPFLRACAPDSGWNGWWCVVDEDPSRVRHGRRDASATLLAEVRAEQARTGRSGVEVRTLRRHLSPARAKTLSARLHVACRTPPTPSMRIMLTPRLVRLGSVQYGAYVVPLGEEHLARAELEVEAWWLSAMLLQRRRAREARAHPLPGDDVTAQGRRAPYAEVIRELHAALAVLGAGPTVPRADGCAPWTAPAATWLAECAWGISSEEATGADPVPATQWISVPTLHRALQERLAGRDVPSIRLLRFRLQSAGVWMRPTRLLRTAQTDPSLPHAVSAAVMMVEAVDAYCWLKSTALAGSERAQYRWTWQWLGLCRDWAAIRVAATRHPRAPWIPLARIALGMQADARTAFADR